MLGAELDTPSVYTDRCLEVIGNLAVLEIQLVVDYDGQLDAERLAAALRLLLEVEPVLGSRFVHRPGRPTWRRIPPGALARERLLFLAEADPSGDADAAIDPFLAEPFPAERGPQVHALILRGGPGDRLVLKVHHLAADTGATKQVAARLCELYCGLGRGLTDEPAVNDGPRDVGAVFEGLRPGQLARLFGRGLARQLRNDLPVALSRVDGAGEERGRPRFLLWHIPPDRVDAIRRFCRRTGATINDVAVTATLRAIDGLQGDGGGRLQHRLTTTVDLRRHLPPGRRVGVTNLSSFVYVDIGGRLGDRFEETLALVKAQMDSEKRGPIGLDVHAFLRPLELLLPAPLFQRGVGGALLAQARRARMANSLTNLGPVDLERLDLGERRATRAFVVVPASRPPILSLGLSGDGRWLTLSAGVYESAVPRSRVASLLRAIDEQLPS